MEPPQQPSQSTNIPRRLQPYTSAFQRISARTGTPIPSLVVSFAILHEVTALVPLVGVYWGARTFGIGERMTKYISEKTSSSSNKEDKVEDAGNVMNVGMFQETLARWTKEGETRVARVGSRYGILGFEKGQKIGEEDLKALGQNISREVANATFAYIVVKALLPLRIGASLYLSPAFSRRVLQPITIGVKNIFKKIGGYSYRLAPDRHHLRNEDNSYYRFHWSGAASFFVSKSCCLRIWLFVGCRFYLLLSSSPPKGFLGSGKTTTILSLLPQLPKDYKVVLLKNEFGDVEVDSQLAKQSSLAAVSEILNGCMCCILVGQMKTALLEIHESFSPDRIIIETSGSAFPATLAFQIRELEKETNGAFKLDAIVTVIDAENFAGYEDTSTTAKMQAAYTDILLINKWELVSERQLDIVMDHLFTLNEQTPKIKCNGKSGVDPSLIFGLDTKLFQASFSSPGEGEEDKTRWINGTSGLHHQEEVEVVTVRRGITGQNSDKKHLHDENCSHPVHQEHQHHLDGSPFSTNGVDGISTPLTKRELELALVQLPREGIYRVKGFIRIIDESESTGTHILNWAFGRFELTNMDERTGSSALNEHQDLLFTVMGETGEVRSKIRKFAAALRASVTP